MATNEEILSPKVLIVPTYSATAGFGSFPKGSLVMSGAALYVATAAGTLQKVTST